MIVGAAHIADPRVIAMNELNSFFEAKTGQRRTSVGRRDFLDFLIKVYIDLGSIL
jgi:hypothetical protein